MRLRITDGSTKVATIVVGYVLTGFVCIALAVTTPGWVSSVASILLSLGLVWFCVRTFRGASEDVSPPRVWWRMTERPGVGFFFAAVFAVQAVLTASVSVAPPATRIAASTVSGLIAVCFAGSSIRLARAAGVAPRHISR